MNCFNRLRALFSSKETPRPFLQEQTRNHAAYMARTVTENPYEVDSTESDDEWLITLEGVAITRYTGTYEAAERVAFHLNAAYNLGYDTGLTMGKHQCKTS